MYGQLLATPATGGSASLAPKPRAVLAMLLLGNHRVVTLDAIVAELWPDPPPAAVANVRSYVAMIRRALGEGTVTTVLGGYRIDVPDDEVDVSLVRRLADRAEEARRAGDPATALSTLDVAYALVSRGDVLVDVPGGPVLDAARARLRELAVAVGEARFELRLDASRAAETIGDLVAHAAAYPLREHAQALLARAYYEAGDTSAALTVLATARRLLRDELGVTAGADLERVQRSILRREPTAPVTARPAPPIGPAAGSTAAGRPAEPPVPRELPAAVAVFVGRAFELDQIVAGLGAGETVVAIDGVGGVGKSALAVRAAHLAADHFPDGQLYVDLRGATPGLPPMVPDEIIARLLRSLGVPPAAVPADPGEAAVRYRSLLARRRVLVVLDNATDAAQVRELLPGRAGSAVLVTSRIRLTALDRTLRFGIKPFTPGEAVELLARLSGRPGTDAAAAHVAELCGRLALALRIAGARLASRDDWTFRHLAERLADERRRLDEMSHDALAVRPSLLVGYEALERGDPLEVAAAGLLRVLGVVALPSFTAPMIAAATGSPDVDATTAALDRLVAARLVEAAGDRYHLHDLTRLVAAELGARDPDRTAYVRRVVLWYVACVRRVDDLMRPGRRTDDERLATGDAGNAGIGGVDRAIAWLEAEHAQLAAVAELGVGAGGELAGTPLALLHATAWHLAKHGHWRDEEQLAQLALRVATGAGDLPGEAHALLALGRLRGRQNRLDEAKRCLARCGELRHRLGDAYGELVATFELGLAIALGGDHRAAIGPMTAALDLAAGQGRPTTEAVILFNLGVTRSQLDDDATARQHLERSLAIRVEQGDRAGEAIVRTGLIPILANLGDWDEALRTADIGVELCAEMGLRIDQAACLIYRSVLRLRAGDPHAALADAEAAAALLDGFPDSGHDSDAHRQLARALTALGRMAEARQHHLIADERTVSAILGHTPGTQRFLDSVAEPYDAGASP